MMDIQDLESTIQRLDDNYMNLAHQANANEDKDTVNQLLADKALLNNLCIAGIFAFELQQNLLRILQLSSD